AVTQARATSTLVTTAMLVALRSAAGVGSGGDGASPDRSPTGPRDRAPAVAGGGEHHAEQDHGGARPRPRAAQVASHRARKDVAHVGLLGLEGRFLAYPAGDHGLGDAFGETPAPVVLPGQALRRHAVQDDGGRLV